MTLFDGCTRESLQDLQKWGERIDIGLHLCFTAEPDAGHTPAKSRFAFGSFGSCWRAAQSGELRKQDVLAEIKAQYDLFVQKTGCPPSHIDGHLHVHQIPVIREALIGFVLDLPKTQPLYIRNTAQDLRLLWKNDLPVAKAAGIGLFGCWMNRRLRSRGIRTNCGFSGVYDFRNYHQFQRYLPRFVKALTRPNGILVVHPGKTQPWRIEEFSNLKQMAFPDVPVRYRFEAEG
jgi:predicted glycoside hydrolase/deacetylase ChbG (UPF0249 family)